MAAVAAVAAPAIPIGYTIAASIFSGITSFLTGRSQSRAAERGAELAAETSLQTVQMQLDEIRRQFDYQQAVLLPRLQQQYAAAGAFADLLGIGANNPVGSTGFNPNRTPPPAITSNGQPVGAAPVAPGQPPGMAPGQTFMPSGGTNFVGGPRAGGPTGARPGGTNYVGGPRAGTPPPGGIGQPGQPGLTPNMARLQPPARADAAGQAVQAYVAGQQQQAGPTGPQAPQTVPTWYPEGVTPGPNDLVAPTPPPPGSTNFARDPDTGYFIDPNVNPRSLEELAIQNEIYGPEFTESPGYEFSVEEMNRALDRRRSAGGNYGGRAVIEAQRRAGGLALGEYYNYAAGREREVGRIEAGAAVDIRREDQAYQNYLTNLRAAAGFGDVSGQVIESSAATAGLGATAIGQGGAQVSQIQNVLGVNQARIAGATGTNVNNAIVQAMENLATYYSQQQQNTPPPGGIAAAGG